MTQETCEHPSYSKERVMGAQTGDKICDACGKELTRAEVAAIDERKTQKFGDSQKG